MDKSVSAAEANRNLSQLLREVRRGKSYVVTSHGKPVARLVPAPKKNATAEGARVELLSRLRSQRVTDVGSWSRDELYEE